MANKNKRSEGEPILLKKFETTVSFNGAPYRSEFLKLINLHYLGDQHVNKYDKKTKQNVPKYPEKETPEFLSANSKAATNSSLLVTLGFYSDGTFKVIDQDK